MLTCAGLRDDTFVVVVVVITISIDPETDDLVEGDIEGLWCDDDNDALGEIGLVVASSSLLFPTSPSVIGVVAQLPKPESVKWPFEVAAGDETMSPHSSSSAASSSCFGGGMTTMGAGCVWALVLAEG